MMGPIFYTVALIDGDYAFLRNDNEPTAPLKQVARALLPEEITEGSRLKWEMFEYELL